MDRLPRPQRGRGRALKDFASPLLRHCNLAPVERAVLRAVPPVRSLGVSEIASERREKVVQDRRSDHGLRVRTRTPLGYEYRPPPVRVIRVPPCLGRHRIFPDFALTSAGLLRGGLGSEGAVELAAALGATGGPLDGREVGVVELLLGEVGDGLVDVVVERLGGALSDGGLGLGEDGEATHGEGSYERRENNMFIRFRRKKAKTREV